ncbi:MAG: hypothetical protein WCW87_01895 [Candidatus Paceibacterota bacterium]
MSQNKKFAILLYPHGIENNKENEGARELSCKVCGYPFAQGGDFCEDCAIADRHKTEEMIASFNEFFHDSAFPTHCHREDRYLDPNNRHDRQFLDP